MKLDTVIARSGGKTLYRDGDNCIKLFDHGYAKADILNEATNQARIEETGLLMPKVREVMMIEGKWAIVSDYIPGKTLAARFSPGYGDLPLEFQREIFRALDVPRRIGVSLGSSCLMSPSKSVTAIVGIKS